MTDVQKKWGYYKDIVRTSTEVYKLLFIKPHAGISLQFHRERAECWYVVKGTPQVIIQGQAYTGSEGDVFTIGRSVVHQIINESEDEVVIFERQYGRSCREDDIVRLKEYVS